MRVEPVPSGWRTGTLGEVARYLNGFAFKPHHWKKDGLPIIRIAQMQNAEADHDYFPGVVPEQNRIDDGDLLFSWSATLMTLIWDRGPAYLNQHIFKVMPTDGHDLGYVHHLIDFCLGGLAAQSHGTTMKHIKRSDLLPFPAVVAPLPEQRRIAEILDTLDEAIRKTEQVIAKLQQMKQGLLHDLLTRGIDEHGELRDPERHPEQFKDSPLGCIPRGWEVRQLGQVTTWLSGGTPSKATPSYWNGDIPWVSPKDMKQFRTGDAQDRITATGAIAGSRTVPPGSVLIVVRGMILAHTFPVCLTTRKVAFNQDVKAVIAGDAVDSTFLAHWFVGKSEKLLGLVTEATHGTKRIDLSDLQRFPLALPTVLEQRRIADILDEQDLRIDGERRELRKLRTLKHGLMDDLLTGQVRVAVAGEATA